MARVLIAVAGALALSWLALIAYVWLSRPDASAAREGARMVPDIVRLVRRIAADRSLPRGVRGRLWGLLAYLALPIDLVPDLLPGIG